GLSNGKYDIYVQAASAPAFKLAQVAHGAEAPANSRLLAVVTVKAAAIELIENVCGAVSGHGALQQTGGADPIGLYVVGDSTPNSGGGQWENGNVRNVTVSMAGLNFTPSFVAATVVPGGNIELGCWVQEVLEITSTQFTARLNLSLIPFISNAGGTVKIRW